MARRSQLARLRWPLTPVQLENIDKMFQSLFDDTQNGTLDIRASQIRSGVLTVPRGGTGLSSYTVGDLLYASGTTTLAGLADVATGNALISGGVGAAPSWGKIDLTTTVSNTLPAVNGGTGQATYAVGDLLYASATTSLSRLADVAVGAYLRSGGVGTAPLWSTLLLPNAASTGDLIQATATNSMAVLNSVSAGSYLRSAGVTTANVWSTVKIPNTASTGDLWQGTSSNNVTALASVAAGSYLRSAGVTTANVWSTLTLPNASVQGDIFYSTAANAMIALAKNTTATRYLSNKGTNNDPSWSQVTLSDGVTGTLADGNLSSNVPLKNGTNAFTGSNSFATNVVDLQVGQLKFPATDNASSDVNTLDDYEEGTWTPAFTFTTPGDLTVSYANQDGSYVKIGSRVFVSFTVITLTFNQTTASGDFRISGLPFTSGSTYYSTATLPQMGGITKAGYTMFAPRISPGTNFLDILAGGSGVGAATVTTADVTVGGGLVINTMIGTAFYSV